VTTFGFIVEKWLQRVDREFRPATQRNYHGTVRQLLAHDPSLKDRPITRGDIVAFRDSRVDAGVCIESVNRHVKAIRACLRWAELNEYGHPLVQLLRLSLPVPARRELTLTRDEIQRALEAAAFDPPVLAIFRICHATGLRLSEVLHLQWRDIHDGAVHVRAKPGVWEPKTPSAIRVVPAPELVKWLEGPYRQRLRFKGPEDWVLQQRPGRPWGKSIHYRLRQCFDRAGIEGKKPSHSFRHTVASDLVESGAPISVTQRLLGHANPAITLGIYARASRDGLERAAHELERYRAGR